MSGQRDLSWGLPSMDWGRRGEVRGLVVSWTAEGLGNYRQGSCPSPWPTRRLQQQELSRQQVQISLAFTPNSATSIFHRPQQRLAKVVMGSLDCDLVNRLELCGIEIRSAPAQAMN